jgi:hypothetical protein
MVFGEGLTMAAQYRDEAKGFDGYIIRKWQEPKVVIRDAITKNLHLTLLFPLFLISFMSGSIWLSSFNCVRSTWSL